MPRERSVMEDAKSPIATFSEGWAQRQRVTSTCAICGDRVEAVVPEAVAWFAQHRRTKHPNLPEPQSRRPRGRAA